MRTTLVLRSVNNQTLDILRKSISKTINEATPYLNAVKEKKKEIVFQKIANLNNWYTKIIGLDEVKQYQDRVTELQEQLLKTQEKRREVSRQLTDIRQKSLELQDEIQKVKRNEDLELFLELMRKETEILKMERSIERTFQDYDGTERELFTAFTNAIRDSHEKQRAQVEYTKYFGLILSITGSFLAFCYTTIKKQDLKNFIEEKLVAVSAGSSDPVILNLVQANEKTVQEILKNRQALGEVMRVISVENSRRNKEPVTYSTQPIESQNMNVISPVTLENETIVKYVQIFGAVCLSLLFLKMFSS